MHRKHLIVLISFLILSFAVSTAHAGPLDNWHQGKTPKLGYGYDLYDVAYGNGTFVAVGGVSILTSSNGTDWTPVSFSICFPDGCRFLYSVTYANGNFIAFASRGLILTSADGKNWTLNNSETFPGSSGITYGNGIFVSVYGSKILKSADAITWTPVATADTNFDDIIYGNGTFVAFGSRIIMTSRDGLLWTKREPGLPIPARTFRSDYLSSGTYGNGTFVIVSWSSTNHVMTSGYILTSTDGITWTQAYESIPGLHGVKYGNGFFVAVGNYGTILYSTDSLTWSTAPSVTTELLSGISYGKGTFVAIGSKGFGIDGIILQSAPIPYCNAYPASSPVYRFNVSGGFYFWTIYEKEKNDTLQNYPGFHLEGTAFCAIPPASPVEGTLPVYRFNADSHHLWTIYESEKNDILQNYPGFRLEGVAFYAFPSNQEEGTLPVYRFNVAGRHFYTIDEDEKNSILQTYPEFRLEGVAFYLYPPE
ncbi:MAG: hypothetical protein HZA17_00035 [Nitrospirae bacterium]|nr:hypothetical protein [Nitrospirota bacterium]